MTVRMATAVPMRQRTTKVEAKGDVTAATRVKRATGNDDGPCRLWCNRGRKWRNSSTYFEDEKMGEELFTLNRNYDFLNNNEIRRKYLRATF